MATGTPAPQMSAPFSSPLLALLRAHTDAGHAGPVPWCPECGWVLSSLLPIRVRVKGLLLG